MKRKQWAKQLTFAKHILIFIGIGYLCNGSSCVCFFSNGCGGPPPDLPKRATSLNLYLLTDQVSASDNVKFSIPKAGKGLSFALRL